MPTMLGLYIHLVNAVSARSRLRDRDGQATTEYALVLLAAALVGLMVVAWATTGGGAARISRLFNSVIDAVIERV
jgi:Flp pilus assembly pilin Flp